MHFLPGIFCSWGFQGEESHDAKRSAEATGKGSGTQREK